ncbi:MAG: universal stress protein [Gammaproteobacteria bacterium]|nr:universal stress protein [Gammaproteobacteria bacterium]
MYKRILVPVDGSNTSNIALREAIQSVGDGNVELRIIHVVEDVVPVWDVEFLNINEIREALRQAGRQILAKAETVARDAGVRAETRLIEATPAGARIASVIAAEAKDWPADLIVIGTHGRRGMDHLLMGSVAEGVVRISPVPVLLIRGR